ARREPARPLPRHRRRRAREPASRPARRGRGAARRSTPLAEHFPGDRGGWARRARGDASDVQPRDRAYRRRGALPRGRRPRGAPHRWRGRLAPRLPRAPALPGRRQGPRGLRGRSGRGSPVTLRLGVLVSGSGTNLQALLDATAQGRLDAEVRLVVSHRPDVFALERAARAGVPSLVLNHREFGSREEFDGALVAALREAGVEWVALAGFMRVLTPVFLEAFAGRMVNIHPSLLPAFPGVDAQRQAFDYGV